MSAATSSPTRRNDRSRTGPEWVSFAVSCLVLALLVGAIGWMWVSDEHPARIEVRTVSVEQLEPGGLEVTVEIRNSGDRPAVDVQIIGETQVDGAPQQFAEQTVDFLTGGEVVTLVVLAPTDDPDAVSVRAASFTVP